MKQIYESEVLYQLMERDGFNIPSSVPPYESEIKAYLINQVKQAYPKLTDYEAEWLLYNYTKHLPADFPISSVSDVTEATFENVVPFAYQSAILKGKTILWDNIENKETSNISLWVEGNYIINESTGEINTSKSDVITYFVEIPSNLAYINGTATWKKIFYYDEGLNFISSQRTDSSSVKLVTDIPVNAIYMRLQYYKTSDNLTLYPTDSYDNEIVLTRNISINTVKMPVLTTNGKNLFDITKNCNYNSDENAYELKLHQRIYLPFKENTSYAIKGTFKNSTSGVNARLKVNYTDGTFKEFPISNANEYKTSGVVSDSNKSINYLIVTYSTGTGVLYVKDLQIEEGTTATTYEPYKTNILTVNEEVELRGIGDVKDTLDCLTGEVVSNFSTYRFSDTDNWSTNTETNAQRFMLNVSPLPIGAKYSSVVCILNDKLTGVKWNQSWNTVNTITCNNSAIAVYLPLGTTIEQCKEFMRGSIAIYRTEESIKTVDLTTVNEKGESVHFMPLEGTMNVQSSGEIIQPTFDMSVPVEATTQNLASFIEMEMEE